MQNKLQNSENLKIHIIIERKYMQEHITRHNKTTEQQ